MFYHFRAGMGIGQHKTRETTLCGPPALTETGTPTVNQAEDVFFALHRYFQGKKGHLNTCRPFFALSISVALILAVI